MGMQITVKDKNDAVKAEAAGRKQAVLAWKGEYEEGDRIIFSLPEKNRFYIIRVDDTMDEAFIYGAGNELVYEVPFAEGKTSYNPKSFTGERHYLTMRYARDYEIHTGIWPRTLWTSTGARNVIPTPTPMWKPGERLCLRPATPLTV